MSSKYIIPELPDPTTPALSAQANCDLLHIGQIDFLIGEGLDRNHQFHAGIDHRSARSSWAECETVKLPASRCAQSSARRTEEADSHILIVKTNHFGLFTERCLYQISRLFAKENHCVFTNAAINPICESSLCAKEVYLESIYHFLRRLP